MYDFDTIYDRRNTDSMKWTVGENELPMWVADMDFKVAPEIREALNKRLEHGIFGYSCPSETWSNAYIQWWKKEHDLTIDPEWLKYTIGVVPAVGAAIRKLSTPAEKVLLMTPVYNHFFYSVEDNGRVIKNSPLDYDAEKSVYAINWSRLENDLADPQTTLMILCNPQNPTGNLWSRETLARIGELALKHHVIVLADEIHCDVTDPGKSYVPFASVSETCRNNCVMFMSPTKCFNIAGLKTSAVCVPNPALRNKMWAALKADELSGVNFLALDAAIVAFEQGKAWLEEAKAYIYQNKLTLIDFIKSNIPSLRVVSSEATYLLWIDCHGLSGDPCRFASYLREKTGLFVSDGKHFGDGNFFRINIACPRATLLDGLNRLKRGVELFNAEFGH